MTVEPIPTVKMLMIFGPLCVVGRMGGLGRRWTGGDDQVGPEQLDRHGLAGLGVTPGVDRAHPALADQVAQLIAAGDQRQLRHCSIKAAAFVVSSMSGPSLLRSH